MSAPKTSDLAELLSVRDINELQGRAGQLIRDAGYSRFVYAFVNPGNWRETGFTALMNGYPSAWLNHYFRVGYTAVDPVPLHCAHGGNFRPLVWGPSAYVTAQQKAFAEDAQGHGIGAGVTFPIVNPGGQWGGFSFAVDHSNANACGFLWDQLAWAQLLAVYVHDAFQRLAAKRMDALGVPTQILPDEPRLTPRELECLKWYAAGKTAWETGRILGISEWTVIYHFRKIREKFGLANRQQVIARAVATGVIQL